MRLTEKMADGEIERLVWLGRLDSNQDNKVQSLGSYR